MHGLINWSVQTFVCRTYGHARWTAILKAAGLGYMSFEPMMSYPDAQSRRMLDAMCQELKRPLADVLEDLGAFLVADPTNERLRRLLRFGGQTYVDFLYSLDDLTDRVQLAVDDLILPGMELREHAPGFFSLTCQPGLPGWGAVLMGMLRTMADDYGALVVLDHRGLRDGCEVVSIGLVEAAFSDGRAFELGSAAG